MSQVSIISVTKNSDMNDFIDLPWKIYEKDDNWVPPLKKAVRRILDREKHPFWKFSEGILYLARRGSHTVGRIVGIIDHNYNRFHNETSGAWGFFECENDPEAAHALFSSVEEWVAARGMTFLRGPLNPSTNYEVGMLIEGFDLPPTIMMCYNPPYYPNLVESYGFTKEKDLLALVLDKESEKAQAGRNLLSRLAKRICEKGKVVIRNARRENFESEMALIKELYHAAWAPNWGFVPMTNEELNEMGQNLVRFMDPELVFFVYYNDEPVGFCIIIPDINPVLKRLNGKIGVLGLLKIPMYKKEIVGLRGLLFGFKRSHQKLGLPLVAFDHLNRLRTEKKPHYQYLEFGWNLEDNHDINQFEMDLGARIWKRYRIYGKKVG